MTARSAPRWLVLSVAAAILSVAVLRLISGSNASASPTNNAPLSTIVRQPAGPAITQLDPYDWNNDQCNDIIARNSATGRLWLFYGICEPGVTTQLMSGIQMDTTSFASYDSFILVGDWDGDSCHDFLALNGATSLLNAFFGNCAGGISGDNPVFLNFLAYPEPYDWLLGPGSWDGGGCPDFIARHGAQLTLFEGNCKATVLTWRSIGSGWNNYNWLLSPQYWDAKDYGPAYCSDLIGREADGDLIWTDQACGSGLATPVQIGNGWGGFSWLLSGADWNNNAFSSCPDILGRTGSNLLLYQGNCNGGFSGSPSAFGTGIDWSQYDYILGDAGPILGEGQPTGSPTPTASPSPSATSTATPTGLPTPSPTPTSTALRLKGDANCNGIVNLNDVQTMLEVKSGIPGAPPPGCTPNLNLDCTGGFTALDILVLAMNQADILYPLPSGCAPIGGPVS